MIKLRLLFSLLLITGFWAQAQEVNFSGKITHPAGELVRISWGINPLSEDRVSHEAKVGEDGSFQMKFALDKPHEVVFRHGEESSTIFLHPGDVLKLSVDAEKFDETLKVTGTTPGANDSRFLAAWFLRFQDMPAQQTYYQKLKDLEGEAFLEWRNGLWKKQTAYLDSFARKTPLSADLKKYMAFRLDFSRRGDLLVYPGYHHYLNKLETDVPTDGPTIKYVMGLPLTEDKAVGSSEYLDYLNSLVSIASQSTESVEENDNQSYFRNKLANIQTLIPEGPSRDLVTGQVLKDICEDGAIKAFDSQIQAYLEQQKGSSYGESVKKIYSVMEKLSDGNPAPAFTLKDLTGQEVSLYDFKGKVVYLDFWASWCGPCRAEMPASHELQKQFEGEEVVFIYVSIDDSEAAWRKGMEELELTGTLLLAQSWEHEMPLAYHIQSIPHYVLIDRYGKLVAYNAARPSSGDVVVKQIQDALSKPYKGGVR